MKRNSHNNVSAKAQIIRYVAVDWASGCIAFFLFNIIRYYLLAEGMNGFSDLWAYLFSTKLIIEQAVVPVGMLGIYWLSGYYNTPFGKSRLQELVTTVFSAMLNTVIIYLVLLINDQTGRRIINYELIVILFGLFFLLPYFFRLPITLYAIRHFKQHQWDFRVIVIGNSTAARKAGERLMKGPSRVSYEILGYVDIGGENNVEDGAKVFSFEEMESLAKEGKVDQIIIAPQSYDEAKVLKILYRLFPLDIPVKISPDTFSFVTSAIRLNDIYGEPFIDLTSPVISESSKNIKRVADILVSSLVLVIFSPVYLWLAIMVKRSSPGRILYSQERIGLRQKPFNIYKFRTMREDAEKDGPQLSSDTDTRITPFGRIMRKYRLDELPQFWNVLKGDMSIVGPRPERAFFIKQIVEEAPYYVLVYQVRPGITSWGMVKYGYASNLEEMVARTRYDLIYMGNMSLYVDAKILIYTVKTVLTGKGV